jgi:hypothetical protein
MLYRTHGRECACQPHALNPVQRLNSFQVVRSTDFPRIFVAVFVTPTSILQVAMVGRRL